MKPATVRTLNAESRSPDAVELLRELIAEQRAMRAEIRAELLGIRADLRELQRDDRARALKDAIEEQFQDGTWTVNGLLDVVSREPDCDLALVLADSIDVTLPERARATALGKLIARMPWIVIEGEHRGAGMYRLIDARTLAT